MNSYWSRGAGTSSMSATPRRRCSILDAVGVVRSVTVPTRPPSCSRSIADLLVDHVQEHLARDEAAEVLAEDLVPPPLATRRLTGAMRRDDHVARPERVPLRQRLGVGHVPTRLAGRCGRCSPDGVALFGGRESGAAHRFQILATLSRGIQGVGGALIELDDPVEPGASGPGGSAAHRPPRVPAPSSAHRGRPVHLSSGASRGAASAP